jgi:hypothetical protein
MLRDRGILRIEQSTSFAAFLPAGIRDEDSYQDQYGKGYQKPQARNVSPQQGKDDGLADAVYQLDEVKQDIDSSG